eukprot:CAMPEP_0172551396 /NCGR_PEP_ID=MMETSP1067-20121228/39046_1 /TAXON_ID=265564 ORGANISM="Thalassiosira punctigera, Strain Tpunct2005C2" /NCGR_SAMPLE_ID=MMETSP1067 /ASSEMBLY_ACC=CAM_ASM_000444 /LENGTH=181 /DNA_ID=CAMNT_0013339181 /DNA_START=93 /DNA_END=634 /DNA_ORIENTATION=-
MSGKAAPVVVGVRKGRSRSDSSVKLEDVVAVAAAKAAVAKRVPRPEKVVYPRQSLPLLRKEELENPVGYVRATPPGHGLGDDDCGTDDRAEWEKHRAKPSYRGTFPVEGFDHVMGAEAIREVDGVPIGGRIDEIDGPRHRPPRSGQQQREECLEPEEEAALAAELAQRRYVLSKMEDGGEG